LEEIWLREQYGDIMEYIVIGKIKIGQLLISFLVIFLCLILIEGNLK
jgi:hypothetical protein